MKPIICYVTGRAALDDAKSTEKLLAKIRVAAASGVDWVQIREREMTARDLLVLTKAAIAGAGGTTRILVNDRLDVALAAGAAGVHLRGESVPVGEAVRWLREASCAGRFSGWSFLPQRRRSARRRSSRRELYIFRPYIRNAGEEKVRSSTGSGETCRSLQQPAHSGDCDWRSGRGDRAEMPAGGRIGHRGNSDVSGNGRGAAQASDCATARWRAAGNAGALGAEPAAHRLQTFHVVANHLEHRGNGNGQNEPHRAPHPSPE